MDTQNLSTNEDQDGGNYQHIIDLQIQLEEIEGVASLAYETCDDAPFAGTLSLIERRVKAIRYELSDLIGSSPTAKLNGFNSEIRPLSRRAMILDLLRGIRVCARKTENCGGQEAVIMDAISIQKAAETIECILAEGSDCGDAAAAVDVAFDGFQVECDKMSPEEVALRLRQHCWEASEILSAFPEENGFSVSKTFTRKGLRYFVAEREFLQSLLPEE